MFAHPSIAFPSPGGHLPVVHYVWLDAVHFRGALVPPKQWFMVTKPLLLASHPSPMVTAVRLTGWRRGEYSENQRKTRGREEHQTRTSLAPGCNRPGSSCHQGV